MMLDYIITNIDFQDTFILITLVAHVILHMYFRAVSAFSRAEQLIIAELESSWVREKFSVVRTAEFQRSKGRS